MANVNLHTRDNLIREQKQVRKCQIGIDAVLQNLVTGVYNDEDSELAQEHINELTARQEYAERNVRFYERMGELE